MDYLKNYYPIMATAIFVLAIVLAHILATNPYDFAKNTISDLGAQHYERRRVMQFGFLVFGIVLAAGVAFNGISMRTAPILIYGLCVALTGVFCTQPFVPIEHYSVLQARLHAAFAQIAGVAFTLGILVQLFYTNDITEKGLHLIFFILVIGLSAAFGLVKNYQGLVQRLLYAVSFIWLVKFYKP